MGKVQGIAVFNVVKQEITNKPIIWVPGMRCSGTGLLARALQVLGVDTGGRLLPSIDGDNDKVLWEDIDINDIVNAMLDKRRQFLGSFDATGGE